jgi:cytochrome c-type biogenesis protein CcmH/NrfG
MVAARQQAQAALNLRPSVEAYLVLGRLDLAANHVDEASKEAGEALKLDPENKAGQELNRKIALKTGNK